MPTEGPSDKPGTYTLLIELAERSEVAIGRLGTVDLEPGLYAYVGSALGPGGLRARLLRHASASKRRHWHVDHLLDRGRLIGALVAEGGTRRECAWAAWAERRALSCIDGFGASDCRCRGHLFRVARALESREGARFVERACRDLGARRVLIHGRGSTHGPDVRRSS